LKLKQSLNINNNNSSANFNNAGNFRSLYPNFPQTFWVNGSSFMVNNQTLNLTNNQYLVFKDYQGTSLQCDRNGTVYLSTSNPTVDSLWTPFKFQNNVYAFQSVYGGYLGFDNQGNAMCIDKQITNNDQFEVFTISCQNETNNPRFVVLRSMLNNQTVNYANNTIIAGISNANASSIILSNNVYNSNAASSIFNNPFNPNTNPNPRNASNYNNNARGNNNAGGNSNTGGNPNTAGDNVNAGVNTNPEGNPNTGASAGVNTNAAAFNNNTEVTNNAGSNNNINLSSLWIGYNDNIGFTCNNTALNNNNFVANINANTNNGAAV
jgi:hypothetical protein